ncbi:MAG: outer membrane beta-barrel protein, partial [Proteobacteria bacterium]|nr:outer membrane beta-barrel protein [Pseudomonadota bacterium]
MASEEFYSSLKIGANVADVTGVDGGSSRLGLNFGLLATIKLSNQFFLVPEFAPLSAKGISKYPAVSTGDTNLDALLGTDNKSSFEFNYLDIPVVLKYYPVKTLNIGLGPYVSYLL